MGNPILGMVAQVGGQALLNSASANRQYGMQRRLNLQGMEISKELTDYNMNKQYELWNATNYASQVNQMKKAGLNPALMYGMGGGGGVTANVNTGSASGGSAPSGNMYDIANFAMLEAQVKNLEADTKKKLSEAGDIDTLQLGHSIDNAVNEYLSEHNVKGEFVGTKSPEAIRNKERITEVLKNSKAIEQMAQSIKLMISQGKKEDEITKNLKKEGIIKDAEIEWNSVGLTTGDFGRFITMLIHQLLK